MGEIDVLIFPPESTERVGGGRGQCSTPVSQSVSTLGDGNGCLVSPWRSQ